MRKRLLMAITSLVVAVTLLTTATYAWFNMSSSVTVGDMEMTVETVGSIYIRTHDFIDTTETSLRTYSTGIDLPSNVVSRTIGSAEAAVLPSVSAWRLFEMLKGEQDVEPEDLPGYLSAIKVLWDSQGDGFELAYNSETDLGMYGLDYTDTQDNPLKNYLAQIAGKYLSFYEHSRMFKQVVTDDMTKLNEARENNNFGKWNIDVLSAAVQQQVAISGKISIPEVYRYSSSIGVQDVLVDFLKAYRVEIYEFSHTGDADAIGFAAKPIAVGSFLKEDLLTLDESKVSTSAFHLGDGENAATIEVLDNLEGEGYKYGVLEYLELNWVFLQSDGTYKKDDNNKFGDFAPDTPRSFEIYYYIDGTTINETLDTALDTPITNQNHLTRTKSQLALEFSIITPEPDPEP